MIKETVAWARGGGGGVGSGKNDAYLCLSSLLFILTMKVKIHCICLRSIGERGKVVFNHRDFI